MSRNLTEAMAAAMVAGTVAPILLFEAEFSSGTVHYWTGIGDLEWNALTWRGIGDLIECAPVDETNDLKAQGIALTVKGISSADVAIALNELRGGQDGAIRLALLEDSGAVIANPKILFRGRMDIGEIDDTDPEKPVILLTYEHELINLRRPREWRLTDEHQRKLFTDDIGMRWMAGLQDKELVWGQR